MGKGKEKRTRPYQTTSVLSASDRPSGILSESSPSSPTIGLIDPASVSAKLNLDSAHLLNIYELGSTSVQGAVLNSRSDIDLVVVVSDDTPRRWHGHKWLVQHGWMLPPEAWTTPAGTELLAAEGFRRDYSGSDLHDVWIYTRSTFAAMVLEFVPFAVECVCLPPGHIWQVHK